MAKASNPADNLKELQGIIGLPAFTAGTLMGQATAQRFDVYYSENGSTWSTWSAAGGDNIDTQLQGQKKWGVLELGQVLCMGIEQTFVRYKRDPTPQTKWVDLSNCMGQEPAAYIVNDRPDVRKNPVKFFKYNDSVYPFSLQVTIRNFWQQSAWLEGTLEYSDSGIKYWLKGKAQGGLQDIPNVKRFTMPHLGKPKDFNPKAQLKTLYKMNSHGQYTSPERDPKTGKKEKRGDLAQVNADKLLYKMMFAALDEKTKKALLPGLKLPESPGQTRWNLNTIVKANEKFLRRGGVHLLAETFKKKLDCPLDIRDSVKDKFQHYMRMMTSVDPPGNPKADPVALYGWDRKTKQKELDELRQQYHTVTQWCYLIEYVRLCPQMEDFLDNPVYWFCVFVAYLTSPPHMEQFLNRMKHEDKEETYEWATERIREWNSKLNMLYHAAVISRKWDPETLARFRADAVMKYISTKVYLHMILTQTINNKWNESIAKWMKHVDKDKLKTPGSIGNGILFNMGKLADKILSAESEIPKWYKQWQNQNLPPTAGKVLQYSPSVASLNECITNDDFKDVNLRKASGLKDLQVQTNAAWVEKITELDAIKHFLKGFFVLACVINVAYSAATGELKVDPEKYIQDIAGIVETVGTAVNAVLDGVKFLAEETLTKILSNMPKGKFVQPVLRWVLSLRGAVSTIAGRFAFAMAGSLSRVVAVIGVVVSLAGVISSAAKMIRDPSERTAANWIDLGLSVLGFAIGLAEIGVAIVVGSSTTLNVIGLIVGMAALALALGGLVLNGLVPLTMWMIIAQEMIERDKEMGVPKNFSACKQWLYNTDPDPRPKPSFPRWDACTPAQT